jgi:hypothetical protein
MRVLIVLLPALSAHAATAIRSGWPFSSKSACRSTGRRFSVFLPPVRSVVSSFSSLVVRLSPASASVSRLFSHVFPNFNQTPGPDVLFLRSPERNRALQRTAPGVTACSAHRAHRPDTDPLTTPSAPQPTPDCLSSSRGLPRPPQSLGLGSLGGGGQVRKGGHSQLTRWAGNSVAMSPLFHHAFVPLISLKYRFDGLTEAGERMMAGGDPCEYADGGSSQNLGIVRENGRSPRGYCPCAASAHTTRSAQ